MDTATANAVGERTVLIAKTACSTKNYIVMYQEKKLGATFDRAPPVRQQSQIDLGVQSASTAPGPATLHRP